MLTDILNESTYLIYRGADASQLVAAAYNCEPSDQGIMLENVVSRKKQLIPALINTLAERKCNRQTDQLRCSLGEQPKCLRYAREKVE